MPPTRRRPLVLASLLVAVPAPARFVPEPDDRGISTIAPLLERVTPAVVNVSVISDEPTRLNSLMGDALFRDVFDFPESLPSQPRLSAGSGVIVDAANGYILTNTHVVAAGARVTVTPKDSREFAAELVGSDPATDIAVLRVDAENLTAIPLGNSDQLKVGDFVVAVGNPFGLGQTVTSGIVSAFGRSGINPEGYEDFIQTDASINPGNSGGALLTLDGRLVGINTAIVSPAGGNVGIGFADPIRIAEAVMDQLVASGEVRRGRLGFIIQTLTPGLAEALGVDVDSGVVVSQIEPGSAAEAAGLAIGDAIVAVDGVPVDSANDLRSRIGLTEPGTEVRLDIVRSDERLVLTAQLGADAGAAAGLARGEAPPLLHGAEFGALGPDMPGCGEVEEVAVLSVDARGPAARAGLGTGDVVTDVNRDPVRTVADLYRRVGEAPGAIALTVWRDGSALFLVLRG